MKKHENKYLHKTNFTVFINFYILLHTHSLDQTKNVLRVTKSRQIITY